MPAAGTGSQAVFRFGVFEADARSGELRKSGVRIALQEQPFRVLVELLQRSGSVVTRDELQAALWPGETFVDFEHGVNVAIARLREALGDDSSRPRFVETLPKRGYRFIAPVEALGSVKPDQHSDVENALSGAGKSVPKRRRFYPTSVSALKLVGTAVAAIVATTGGIFVWRHVEPTPGLAVYAAVEVPTDFVLGDDDTFSSMPTRTPMTFTPDGRSLVFQAAHDGEIQLFLRPLDRSEARPVPGTEGGRVPFVSPDGKWIGFWAHNELRRVPIDGGTITTICPLRAGTLGPFGAHWGANDVIVFGDVESGRIMRVSARGGTPTPVTRPPSLSERRRHIAPTLLPEGQSILFSDVSTQDASDSRILIQTIAGGEPRLVISSATDGRVLPSGHLAFLRVGSLMTVPFDVVRGQTIGDPVTAMSGVMQGGIMRRDGMTNPGPGMFAVSNLGALAVIRGSMTAKAPNVLVWQTRDGRLASAEPTSGAPVGARANARISPTGDRALVTVERPMRLEIWIADWKRDSWTACSGCTSDLGIAAWSPDGTRVLLGTNGAIVAHTLDESKPDQILVRERDRSLLPMAWLPQGQIVYLSSPDLTNYEIKLLNPNEQQGRVIVPLGVGTNAVVSHDGKWLAYTEWTSRVPPITVTMQAFPGPGPRAQVSAPGASDPVWSADDRSLYYLQQYGRSVMAVDIQPDGTPTGPRHEVLRIPERFSPQMCLPNRCFDIAADGRFLFIDRSVPKRETIPRIDLVLNWTSTLAASR